MTKKTQGPLVLLYIREIFPKTAFKKIETSPPIKCIQLNEYSKPLRLQPKDKNISEKQLLFCGHLESEICFYESTPNPNIVFLSVSICMTYLLGVNGVANFI